MKATINFVSTSPTLSPLTLWPQTQTLKGLTPYEFMQSMGFTARTLHLRPAPSNTGTKHLAPYSANLDR